MKYINVKLTENQIRVLIDDLDYLRSECWIPGYSWRRSEEAIEKRLKQALEENK